MSSRHTVRVECLDKTWEVTGDYYKEEPETKTSPGVSESFEVTAFVLIEYIDLEEHKIDMTWLWDNDAFDEEFMSDIQDNALAEIPEDIPPEDEDEVPNEDDNGDLE